MDPSANTIVLLWDPDDTHFEAVAEMVRNCGSEPTKIQDTSRFDTIVHVDQSKIALVALGESQFDVSESLELIRTLKARGFKVIAYAAELPEWPISVRCRALLSGASLLLDSSSCSFRADFGKALSNAIEVQVKERSEENEIRKRMTELGIVGESLLMMSVLRWVMRVSTLSDFPVLIGGETGTGKELIANALHRLDGKRRSGPFVVANCGAISAGLAESEFFGHRRGAFTGADHERRGLFRAANGGILFLDEIGELNESLQAKLLRVLQEKRVLGVGFDEEVAVDVRVVAATNRNLEGMVRAGSFRQDLFHRLNVLSVSVPPLRERLEDLRPLVVHFLKKYCYLKQYQNPGVQSELIEALMHLELSGNVRQLENIIRTAVLNKTDDTPLGLCDLTPAVWQQISETEHEVNNPRNVARSRFDEQQHFRTILDENSWNLPKALERCERSLLECVLQSAQGNQSRAARLTGISARSVYNKLHKHKLNV